MSEFQNHGLVEADIAVAAYFIWEDDGRPHGKDKQHWEDAIKQLCDKGRNESKMDDPEIEPQIVWHYTVASKVRDIQRSLILKKHGKPGQVPAVWFSKEPEWEPTAACNFLGTKADGTMEYLDRDQLHEYVGPLFRFGVLPEKAPLTWSDYRKMVSKEISEDMLAGAEAIGANADKWRVSMDSIPQSDWHTVQYWDGTAWKTLNKSGNPQ